MTPLDHYIALCRSQGNTPEGQQRLRLAHDYFVHAETLCRHLARCGLPVMADCVNEDGSITLAIVVDAPPPALVEALEDGNLKHTTYDFKCDHDQAYAVYHVECHGATYPVIAHTRLVDREDRAALISKKAA